MQVREGQMAVGFHAYGWHQILCLEMNESDDLMKNWICEESRK